MKKILMRIKNQKDVSIETYLCPCFALLLYVECYKQVSRGISNIFETVLLIMILIYMCYLICFDRVPMQNPLNEYDSAFLLQKEFEYDNKQFRILQYFAYDQTDEGRKFVCLRLDTGQQEIFQEDELKLAIAKGEAKVNI